MGAHDITTLDQLRALYREPSELVKAKKGEVIDGATAEFLAESTFFCLATSDAQGNCDVSPRGGPAGQLKVLDDGRSVAFPDLSGNNLIDSLSNIVDNGHVGILAVVPGSDETLRIDGAAALTTDPAVLGLWSDEVRTPKVAVVVEVDAAFLHCAKAFRRGDVWSPEKWSNMADTTPVRMFSDLSGADLDPVETREFLEEAYAADLAAERVTTSD